jgi:Flp pilus assembly protein TadG
MIIRRKLKNKEGGQVLILCAVCMVVLLLFVGLAIDFGLAYVTKARLGKAVDAATLSGANYLYQGQDKATAIAQSSFAMNYPTTGLDVAAPIVNVTFPIDPATGNTLIAVQANATTHTFFIGLLPSFKTLSVSASAQANRAHVIMTVVLDRSSSMNTNGGATYLGQAVNQLVTPFDDTLDSVAMVSFASNVTTNVPMPPDPQTGGFKTPIANAARALNFNGHTFSDGGLKQAIVQNDSKAIKGSILKVVVFFTDGYANTIQDTLVCNGASDPIATKSSVGVQWNYGGYSPQDGGVGVGFMNPTSGAEVCTIHSATGPNTCCSVPGTFPAASNSGVQTDINQTTVGIEAQYRAIATADSMRSDPAGKMTVYAIGLGTAASMYDSFYRIANDPRSSTFNSRLPVGQAYFANNASELPDIFSQLAYKILLRMTQ